MGRSLPKASYSASPIYGKNWQGYKTAFQNELRKEIRAYNQSFGVKNLPALIMSCRKAKTL